MIKIMTHRPIKQHIIKTASDLFYSKGYNLTGINEIIKEAQIAKATLYYHFKSKDEICIAYLQHKNNELIKSMTTFISNKKAGKARVLSIFDFLHDFFNKKEFNGCWCLRTIAELPKNNSQIINIIKQQKLDFLNFIHEVVANNIKNRNVEIIAKQIYILYEGAVAESHLHQAPWPIESARSIAKNLL